MWLLNIPSIFFFYFFLKLLKSDAAVFSLESPMGSLSTERRLKYMLSNACPLSLLESGKWLLSENILILKCIWLCVRVGIFTRGAYMCARVIVSICAWVYQMCFCYTDMYAYTLTKPHTFFNNLSTSYRRHLSINKISYSNWIEMYDVGILQQTPTEVNGHNTDILTWRQSLRFWPFKSNLNRWLYL